jgi:hypothetical protein
VDEKGLWTRITQVAPQGKADLTRLGGIVSRTLVTATSKEIKDTIELKPNTVLFDNNGPALVSQIVRLYDKGKGGKQTFWIFVLPGGDRGVPREKGNQDERNGRD